MIVADLQNDAGMTYPARRTTRNIAGGRSPIQARNFCFGIVTLEARGGQVPWHNHEQEETYFILDGSGEMCVGEERRTISAGQAVYIPSKAFHQLTNTGDRPMTMIYCYGPAGEVMHWKQELEGSLPRAGVDAPPLPNGAVAQFVDAADADAV